MKRILVPSLVVFAAAAAFALPALATTPTVTTATTTTPAAPPPVQGNHVDVMLYVDTVQNSHPQYGVLPAVGCSITNLFKQGNGVVFRAWGVETNTGDALTTANVKYAYVKLPNPTNASTPTIVKLSYGAHGTVSYWTGSWNVPLTYPLGVVPFRVVFRTTAYKFGQFTQANMPASSQLTITP